MPPIEENIENDTDEEESDVGIETDAGMEDTGVYNQSRDRKSDQESVALPIH